jgi:hypothetical protein
MQRIKPDVDIILDVLQAVLLAKPGTPFVESLLLQYQERGGLSKKQLQGLYSKASKISTIPASKLATLEAIIKKKHTKEKSALPATVPLYEKDENTGQMIASILAKYPQHKRVVFFRSKYENNEPLSAAEKTELAKFSRLLK